MQHPESPLLVDYERPERDRKARVRVSLQSSPSILRGEPLRRLHRLRALLLRALQGGHALLEFGQAGGHRLGLLAGAVRTEAESMARAQVEAMVQRLELVRREELDAALEVARRAREQAEALAVRVEALEQRLAGMEKSPDNLAGLAGLEP